MFVPAIVPAILTAALFMTAPNTIGPMFVEPPDPLVLTTIIGAGILGYVLGLAWMIRIYRADPEAHASFWRSHRS